MIFLCFSTTPTKEKLDANYVFNENKSVKWSCKLQGKHANKARELVNELIEVDSEK